MERELSRFIRNSDISRINHAAPGEHVRVCRWTIECIELARTAFRETGGAFDILLGTGLDRLEVSWNHVEERRCLKLDLGGIGKGYALDRMAEVLDEWDIRAAPLHVGHSSVLALDPPQGLDG